MGLCKCNRMRANTKLTMYICDYLLHIFERKIMPPLVLIPTKISTFALPKKFENYPMRKKKCLSVLICKRKYG